ncbi:MULTISPECIES: hypothetical protein [Streptomyces]|uniref:hypothetical protein n=1 Tax=Streptomyces TaxID=1883 RepID=UPI001F3B5F15|nr:MULTISPECIES: hypothetical protein [Streptomyces]
METSVRGRLRTRLASCLPQGIVILKKLLALVHPRLDKDDGEDKRPLSGAEVRDHPRSPSTGGAPGSVKYTALGERITQLRGRIIQNAMGFLSEALRVARASGMPGKHPDEAVVVLDDDQWASCCG